VLLGTIEPGTKPLFDATWRAWWIGDATGVVVVLPAILMLLDHRRTPDATLSPAWSASRAEVIALFAASMALCGWAFSNHGMPVEGRRGYEMLVFLPVAWCAIRCGPRVTAILIVAVDAFTSAFFLGGMSRVTDTQSSLAHLQLFMVAISLSGVPLAISIDGLRAARESLRRHSEQLAAQVRARTLDLEASLTREQHANAAKSDFLANISHELRTPMHAIRSFATLGIARSHSAEREKLSGYFERIDASSRRLLALLNDLLDLSKLEAGRMEMSRERVDVSSLVNQSLAEAEPVALAGDVTLTSSGILDEVVIGVDQARLQQVLMNVLSNAIKFSSPGSSINTAIAMETIDGSSWAVVTVTDAGVGIPEGELEAIFDKFVQSSTTRSGAGGTGLGLAICREIIRAHDGSIHAEHVAEGGTRFVIRLPA